MIGIDDALLYMAIASMVIGTAATAYSVMNQPSVPQPPSASQAQQDQQALEASYAQAELLRKRRGAASTIMTSPLGITSQPSTFKTQLGG